MKTKCHIVTFGLFLIFWHSPVLAQIFDTRPGKAPDLTNTQNSIGAYYNFGSETGLNITVSLWGYVRNPGRYVIPSNSNLIEFLSFGGGPTEGADLTEVKVIRKVVGSDSMFVERTYVYDIEQVIERKSSDRSTKGSPPVLPGDTIIVTGSPPVGWVNIASVIAQAIWAITSVVSIVRLVQGK
jgi:hypothetical protein